MFAVGNFAGLLGGVWRFGVGAVLGALFVFAYYFKNGMTIAALRRRFAEERERQKKQLELERKETLLRLRDELHAKRKEFEREMRKLSQEIQAMEKEAQKKQIALDKRDALLESFKKDLERREQELERKYEKVTREEARIRRLYGELVTKLERASSMSRDEAKRELMGTLQEEVKLETKRWIAKVEDETRAIAKEKARKILCTVMQRYLVEQVTMHSSSVVHLPNEEMKGRIIGKEGRNIKALEVATGMEFVIGDTPEVITISGFNPIRREIAKRALQKLMQDGRINPTRIEETVAQCEQELDQQIEEIGQQVILEFGFTDMHQELVKLLGSLYFRTSYTQNNLVHSKEVAYFARMIAAELGLDERVAARAGLLHDIGKAVSAEVEGPHAIVGADLAKKYGEDPYVVAAIASHHEDVPHKNVYGIIVQIADAISASRPGARKETLAAYIKRIEQLEEIAGEVPGVKKAFALQAGRELRVIVDENSVDDSGAVAVARDIAKRIGTSVRFPGQIKVNVIREKRVVEYAR